MKHKKRGPVCLISLTLCCTVASADDRRLIEKQLRGLIKSPAKSPATT
jgi:hypothetical protein